MSLRTIPWIHNLIYLTNEPTHLNHLRYPSAWFERHLNDKITRMEYFVMARKNTTASTNRGWTETKFVTIRLNGKHKDGFREYMQRPAEEVALDVATFMSNGHKTSITWNGDNACWIVAATCKEESSKNLDHCLSSRSSEWYEALCMNVYKNDVICNKGAWVDQQEDSDWG